VDTTGEMALEFYQYAGVGTNTLLSMGFSVDLLSVLHTTARYFSRDTREELVDSLVEAAPPP